MNPLAQIISLLQTGNNPLNAARAQLQAQGNLGKQQAIAAANGSQQAKGELYPQALYQPQVAGLMLPGVGEIPTQQGINTNRLLSNVNAFASKPAGTDIMGGFNGAVDQFANPNRANLGAAGLAGDDFANKLGVNVNITNKQLASTFDKIVQYLQQQQPLDIPNLLQKQTSNFNIPNLLRK